MRTLTRPNGTTIEVPDRCTICGELFSEKEKKGIFPYPEKNWLCLDCFTEAMDTGLGRLNKTLRGEQLTEEDFKPHSRYKVNEDEGN